MDVTINSTEQARTSAGTLSQDAAYYTSLVEELRNASTQIQSNWEGDAADINDIVSRIEVVCGEFESKIIPTLKDLSGAVISLADDIDTAASSTVESGSKSGGGDKKGSETDAAKSKKDSKKSSKPGFWAYHGEDFCDDWNFSGCDSGLDYVGAALGGVCSTVGSVVNFAVDGVSEIPS